MKLCYNPFFIAMGTTMPDYLNPEFVLFGVWEGEAAEKAEKFYKTIQFNGRIFNQKYIKCFQ